MTVLIMKMARNDRKGEGGTTGPYNVNLLHYFDFYNLEFLTKSIVVNRNKSTSGKKENWLFIKWFQFTRGSTNVGFKYDVNSEFDYIAAAKNKTLSWNNIILRSKYDSMLPVSLAKKKDLLGLLKKGVIPREYSTFYQELPLSTGVKDYVVWEHDYNEEETN